MKFAQAWPQVERLSRAAVTTLSGMARELNSDGGRNAERVILNDVAGQLHTLNNETAKRGDKPFHAGDNFMKTVKQILEDLTVDSAPATLCCRAIVGAIDALCELGVSAAPELEIDEEADTEEFVVDD